jgi:hypothetical protein
MVTLWRSTLGLLGTDSQLARVLQVVQTWLRPNGRLLLDIENGELFRKRFVPEDLILCGDRTFIEHRRVSLRDHRVSVRWLDKKGSEVGRFKYRIFDAEEIRGLLRSTGYHRVKFVKSYRSDRLLVVAYR